MADIAPVTTAPLPVVALPDEIDMATADALGEQFAAALAPGVPAVIADMTGTTFCDSAGITVLIGAKERATASGAELRLLRPSRTSCAS
jgi:anti-anti-sigma factor